MCEVHIEQSSSHKHIHTLRCGLSPALVAKLARGAALSAGFAAMGDAALAKAPAADRARIGSMTLCV